MKVFTLIFFIISSLITNNCQAQITIEQNGYSGIVVAFSPSIPEAEGYPLIDKIKELFTNGSHVLYTATQLRAYFKQVTILIPKTWSKKSEYQQVTSEIFSQAAIRIDYSTAGDGPYTLQPMPCGQPGQYIHLTPGYLKNLHDDSTTLFGDPGRTLVHEWAHLRYGIFDEFGYPGHDQYPMFYINPLNEEVRPNYCADEELKGSFINTKNENRPCEVDLDDIPDENCIFQPLLDNDVTSSLGSYHYLSKVRLFCDDDKYLHNPYAPNQHNLLCKEKSAWKVITEHEDFQNKNLPKERQRKELNPTFVTVQEGDPIFILVLDYSSSMEGNRINMLQSTVRRWILEEVKAGWTVGIVRFDTEAKSIVNPTRIIDANTKQDLINKISADTRGSTCIGCGLNEAMASLRRIGQSSGGTAILVTDGDHNVGPTIESVLPQVTAFKMRVVSIAYTKQKNKDLELITKETGGKAFFVSEASGMLGMGSAFYEAVVYQQTDIDISVKLKEDQFSMTNKTLLDGTFLIDSTVGNQTNIIFAYNNEDDIENIRITGSGNFNVSMLDASTNDFTIRNEPSIKFISFEFKYLMPGSYNYIIHRKGTSETQVIVTTVTSMAITEGTKPIVTRCWAAEDKSALTSNLYIIYAEVKQGLNPVIGATVIARIDKENGESIMIELYDKGNGAPDIIKNDGIYSRYFTKATTQGRYTLQATVTGNDKSSIREMGFTASRSMPIANKYIKDSLKATDKPTGGFERFSDGGSFMPKQSMTTADDILPPARVTDLRLLEVAPDNSYVKVQWTAPGDDYDSGNASSYAIKYSSNRTMLRPEFNGTELNSSTPFPAGETEIYNFTLPELAPNVILYMALQTKDKEQWSETSNILEIRGLKPAPPPKSDNVGQIVGIVIGVLLAVVVTGLVCLVIKKRRDHRRTRY